MASSTSSEEENTMMQASMIVDSIAFPMTMQAAIDLGLLEIIAASDRDGGMTAAEVAHKLPAEGNPGAAGMVDRILRLLGSFSVVRCSVNGDGDRVYGMTAVGRKFVKDEDGVSMAPLMTLVTDTVFTQSWYKLKESVLEGGIAFNKVYGMNAFEYPATDPRFNHLFNLAMFNHTSIVAKKILQSYKGFEDINQIVDVGGGLGHNLKIILSNYPKMKGINFDLPHVLKDAITHPRLEHMGGDMFEAVPSADAIFMKWILHDWSDEHCVKLLKNCHEAIGEKGKVIVVEAVVSDEVEPTSEEKVVSQMDMVMMTQNPGGKERSRAEFGGLAKEAGFAGIRFECYVCNLWVMEFYK